MNREGKYLSKQKLSYREKIDMVELAMIENFPELNCELKHQFTDGMYIRTILMKANTFVSSKIHNTQHPFNISMGAVSVKLNENEWKLLEAPYLGITEPGTHRLLYVHYDTLWTTYHLNPTNTRDLDEIEARIIRKHTNPLLNKFKQSCLTHS